MKINIKYILYLALFFSVSILSFQPAFAIPITISDVPGYGYNSGTAPFVGCGPTTGAMILDTYDNRLSGDDGSPGDLVADPLATAWDLHNNYMATNSDGFGPANLINSGFEDYAYDNGYLLDAVLHVESTTYNPSDWTANGYDTDNIVADANFWIDTITWDIDEFAFLNFIAPQVNAGAPMMVTVDSDGNGGSDHWMVCLGYDYDTLQWAGYNTYDTTLRWYDVESAFVSGNYMGIGHVRTFDFLGPIDTGDDETPPVPEPATMLLLGTGLLGLAGFRKKNFKR